MSVKCILRCSKGDSQKRVHFSSFVKWTIVFLFVIKEISAYCLVTSCSFIYIYLVKCKPLFILQMTKSWSDVKSMSGLSSQLTHQYNKLCTDCIGAVASASNPEVSGRLSGAVHDLGTACINTVTMAATCQTSGDDYTHREFADTNRVLAEKVNIFLKNQ